MVEIPQPASKVPILPTEKKSILPGFQYQPTNQDILARDTINLFYDWKRASDKWQGEYLAQIEKLKKRYNWPLGLAIAGLVLAGTSFGLVVWRFYG